MKDGKLLNRCCFVELAIVSVFFFLFFVFFLGFFYLHT